MINIFEVCNEPNLMLKPKGDEVHAFRTIDMFRTAQRVSEGFDHQLHLAGPGLSDRTSATDPANPDDRYVRFERFMDLMRSTGFKAAGNFVWTHHNYGDVEADNIVNADFVRSHINTWWTGYDEGDGPVVFCTEGGARLAKMGGNNYTGLERQATRVGNAFQRLKGRSRVGMQSNYMTCDDVTGLNSGLVDPPPSTAWRSGMATWASVTTGATDVRKWRVGQLLPAWTQWDPGFLSRHESHLEVFAIGSNKQCYNNWSGNGGASWSGWGSLGGGCSSAPGVVSMRSDLMDVFVVGDNNQLWHKFWSAGAGWGNWYPREGWCTYDPAPASRNDQHLDVFVRWGDGTLWHRWWTLAGGWVGWSQLFGGQVVGSPSAVSWGEGRIDLVFRGTDNRIHHMFFSNGWHGPSPLPGAGGATGSPEITSWKSGHLDVICPGAGGKLWRLTYDRLWGEWEPIPHTGSHTWSPGATTYKYGYTGRLDLMFHRGNQLQHVYLT